MRSYLDFPIYTSCQNVTPCWIPQASTMIESISNKYPICDTFKKYRCMLTTIKIARNAAQEICLKSCKAEGYEILTRTADIDPFTRVKLSSK